MIPLRSRRVPYVPQMEITDCGAACLAMTLGYFGREVSVAELRQATGTGRDGVTAFAIAEAARAFGLEARGVRVDVEELALLPRASILHWDFDHFVVFDGLARDGVKVLDPGVGRDKVSREQFSRSFTGVAITFEPGEAFVRDRTRATTRGRSLTRFLQPVFAQRRQLAAVIAASILIQLLALAVSVFSRVLLDTILPAGDRSLLVALTAGLLGVAGFQVLSSLLRAKQLLWLRTHADRVITSRFMRHLVDLPYSFFLQRSDGDLMMRVASNSTVREILTSSVLSAALDGGAVLVYLVILLLLNAPMALVTILCGLGEVAVLVLSRRGYRRLTAENLSAMARTQGHVAQVLAGIESLKASGTEGRAIERWADLYTEELRTSVAKGELNAVVESVLSGLRIAAPLLVLAVGAVNVLDGALSIGALVQLSLIATGFLTPLATLVSNGMQMQSVGGYIARIQDVLDKPREAETTGRLDHRLRGAIKAESLSFRYASEAPLVLRDVGFEVGPGMWVAIVGRSGSGKTTLARLLLGLYPPTRGRILFDGVDLAELDLRSLRRQVGVVPQAAYLFAGSIRDNIALHDAGLPLDAVRDAAELACIDADVVAMPMGYDTVLADGGASLSGGQRQRLALARALAAEPRIMLLDEATSDLDTVTEAAVMANLTSLNVTRVVVAHRVSTIAAADLILVVEDGRLAEQGRHDELLGRGGLYAELVAAQGLRG
ncbi:MAG TPA: peptidase domain-containing ABC transporter [Candidatus Dormibacteraeota bacterium]